MSEELDFSNKQFKDALNIIERTRNSLFFTGKAGTGKSTFLRHIDATTKKKHIILAPTGIAAINVGGQTLHSFFKIPFHPLLPTDVQYNARNIRGTLKYSAEKIKLIRELELIIIDEISMVRADIIDFIDKVLRVYSQNMRQPFGGKQLLLVGDIYQLEPVLKDDDRKLLQPFYTSGYFFAAHVWRQMQLVSIELKKVYRQSDREFINILDRIRESAVLEADIKAINSRVAPVPAKQQNADDSIAITLSTRRDTVDYINHKELNELEGEVSVYKGHITGDFPESMLPTLMELELKPGAQIIFIKNDQNKRWVNGTLGIITGMDEGEGKLYVHTEAGEDFDVEQAQWSNVRYTFNEKEKKVEEEELGTFTQYPLRLAWAITVHKSQGLTFNNVNIDLTGGAFAGGQTYVALSRCRSLEGITLKEPLRKKDIFVREEVKLFARQYNDQRAIDSALRQSQADIEYAEAIDCFDKGDFQSTLDHFFVAIHQRYDIEKPAARRLIRKKLSKITLLEQEISRLNEEISRLKEEREKHDEFLKELAVEYVIMGKECEKEHLPTAAISNYEKALRLCPTYNDANKRLKKLKSQQKNQ
ncbi:AAA family ATPase [Prevotella sp. PINT]|jgi:PIF1 helicase.|uniref:ATP-dependent DNA helicase n=1 Tax=Palleniella intestinalis TaxID=2736291 RepID=UPI001553EFE8|nr:AAA family ATPase [Palleniella intestinalis]NPD80506.1 AAA family ATPase [Palleniella intestinalis]